MTSETVLFRQVHPDFAPAGQLTSQAFFPFPKDEGRLSVYNGDQITAADSFEHYTRVLKNPSAGVWGVTCGEAAGLELPAHSDPLPDSPAHALIDFTGHSEGNYRKLAKKLKEHALARGSLHAPL